MEKIGVKKEIIKNSVAELSQKSASINQTEKILVENFVTLQKVMVNLSEKFTNLSSQISKLLELFEHSAKTLAEKGFEDNREIINKLDSLLDQNRIIAKGISLLHEEETEHEYESHKTAPIQKPMPPRQNIPFQKPQLQQMHAKMQKPPIEQIQKDEAINMQEYQKSISSP